MKFVVTFFLCFSIYNNHVKHNQFIEKKEEVRREMGNSMIAETIKSLGKTPDKLSKDVGQSVFKRLFSTKNAKYIAKNAGNRLTKEASQFSTDARASIGESFKATTTRATMTYNAASYVGTTAWSVTSTAFLGILAVFVLIYTGFKFWGGAFTEWLETATNNLNGRLHDASSFLRMGARRAKGFTSLFWLAALAAMRVIRFVVLGVITFVHAFLAKYVVTIAKHSGTIIAAVLATFLLKYFLQQNVSTAVKVANDVYYAGTEVYNLGVYGTSIALDVSNLMAPITNAPIRESVLIMRHVYRGLSSAMNLDREPIFDSREGADVFQGNGRRLMDVPHLFNDARVELLDLIGRLYAYLLDLYTRFVVILIDVFFEVLFTPLKSVGNLAWGPIEAILEIVPTLFGKLACMIAGNYCTIAELGDFLVNGFLSIIQDLVRAILPFVKMSDWKVHLACGRNQFIGTPCTCAGELFSFVTYGIFQNLDSCDVQGGGRRLLLECRKDTDGSFIETFDGQTLNNRPDEQNACPHTRRSLDAVGHARNMEKFDVHDCYDVCSHGVLWTACEGHKMRVRGTCGGVRNVTKKHALDRLAFLESDRRRLSRVLFESNDSDDHDEKKKKEKPAPRRRTSSIFTQSNALPTMREYADQIRASVPTKFDTPFAHCELDVPFYENVAKTMCFLSQRGGSAPTSSYYDASSNKKFESRFFSGRNLGEEEEEENDEEPQEQSKWADYVVPEQNSVSKKLLELASTFRHRARLWRASNDTDDVFERLAILTSTEVVSHNDVRPMYGAWHQLSTKLREIKQRRLEEKEKYLNRRRSLRTTQFQSTCQEDEFECANDHQCVKDLNDCEVPTEWTPTRLIRHWLTFVGVSLHDVNPGTMLEGMNECWDQYEQYPHRDPFSYENLVGKNTDGVVYCFPMIKPVEWRPQVYEYSVRQSVSDLCKSYTSFDGCNCPEYFTNSETPLPFVNGLSHDLLLDLLDGLIWLRKVIFWATARVFGWAWVWGGQYQLTFNEDIFCFLIHTGSFAVLVLVTVFAIATAKFMWELADFLFKELFRPVYHVLSDYRKPSSNMDKYE